MTVPATVRKAGPFNGAGTITPYPFSFKIFSTTDVQVVQADSLGNETILSSGYSVTMNPDQVALPGGSVTLTTALPVGYKLTLLGALPYDQTLSIPGGGNFDPVSLERALDRIEMQVQQVTERNSRAMTNSPTDTLSTNELPGAVATNIIGWDATGTKLQNYTGASFAIASANWSTSAFNGDAATVSFVLPTDAGVASNCAVSVGGVVQAADINFSYTQATKTITFLTGAPPVGTNNVVVRYGVAVPQGISSNVAITGGTIDGAVIGQNDPRAAAFTTLKLNNNAGIRLRNAITAAMTKNQIANQPLIAPSAWTISTAYVPGQAVTNSGNVYICITAGTSAGAGGPSTTVAGLIADNTVSWYYAGPSFSSASTAPTSLAVTNTAYTGTYFRTTTGTYPIGSSQVSDSGNFLVGGGLVTETGQNNGFSMTQASTPVPSGQLMTVQFMCDAKQLQVHIAQVGSSGVAIYVDQNDGNGLTPLTLGISGVNNGANQNYYQIVWPVAKPRLYVVEIASVVFIQGLLGIVLNDTTSKVWKPTNPNKYRIMCIGDSWFNGSSTYPVSPYLLIPSQVAKQIGCTDFIIDGVGGSGYIAAGSGSAFSSSQRLAFLASMSPDVVFIEGGTNDAGTALATEQAAVLAYLQAIRSALPNAIIFISGCNTNNSGPSANAFTIELAISNAVTAFNDSLTFFYPMASTTAAKAWLSGTGTTAATTGSGNCDIYIAGDVHPTYQGAAYIAYRHANAIRTAVNGAKFV